MLFRRKRKEVVHRVETGEIELVAIAVAAVEKYLRAKLKEKAKPSTPPREALEIKAVEASIPTSSWTYIWRYEVSQYMYRRGGVRQ